MHHLQLSFSPSLSQTAFEIHPYCAQTKHGLIAIASLPVPYACITSTVHLMLMCYVISACCLQSAAGYFSIHNVMHTTTRTYIIFCSKRKSKAKRLECIDSDIPARYRVYSVVIPIISETRELIKYRKIFFLTLQ